MKNINRIFIIVLSLILSLGLFVSFNVFADSNYVIGEDVNFANSQGQGYIDTNKNVDGSVDVSFKAGAASSARLYYSASGAETYRVSLYDFTLKMSVSQLGNGGAFWISFLNEWDHYPLAPWGLGLGLLIEDDITSSNGNFSVRPKWSTATTDVWDGDRNWWFNFDNNLRPSYLDEVFTLRSVKYDESNLLITFSYDNGTEQKLNYSNLYPIESFTNLGMDPESVVFMMAINEDQGSDFKFTIHEFTDARTKQYEEEYANDARDLIDDALSITNDSIDANAVKNYFQTKIDVNSLSNLRKADRFLKDSAVTHLNDLLADYKAATVLNKAALFGSYDDEFEVNEGNILEVENILYIYEETKIDLDDEDINVAMDLLLAKTVGYAYSDEIEAVETLITELLGDYEVVDASNYLLAKAKYKTVLNEYNALNSQIKQFVTNASGLVDFAETLNNGELLYYANEGTNWENYNDEAAVRAFNENGSTKLILKDSHGQTRVLYGDSKQGYLVDIENFQLKFVINSLENTGRFSFNFGESRDVFPNIDVGKQGLSIVFRSSTNKLTDVALKDASNDLGLTFGSPLNEWGKYGEISNEAGLRNVEVVMSFEKVSEGYKLTFKVDGGVGFDVVVPNKFFNDRGLDTTKLYFNISTGEGGNYNNNKDIELTINEISGNAEDLYRDLLANVNSSANDLKTIYNKIMSGNFNVGDVTLYNNSKDIENLDKVRTSDVAAVENIIEEINFELSDAALVSKVVDKIAALATEVTENNYEDLKSKVAEIDELILALTEEQKDEVINLEDLADVKNSIVEYEDGLETEDPDPVDPNEPEDIADTPDNTVLYVIFVVIGAALLSLGAIVLRKFVLKK